MQEINAAGGKALGISTDCSDKAAVKAAFDLLKKEMGSSSKLAAAIYNVGGGFIRKPFLELSEEEFENGWSANGFVFSFLSPISIPFYSSSPAGIRHRCMSYRGKEFPP